MPRKIWGCRRAACGVSGKCGHRGSSRGMCFWGDPKREMGLVRAGHGEGSVFPSLGQFLGAAASPPGQEARALPSDPEFGARACLGLMGLCQPRSTHWAWCPHKSRESLVWEETWPGLCGIFHETCLFLIFSTQFVCLGRICDCFSLHGAVSPLPTLGSFSLPLAPARGRCRPDANPVFPPEATLLAPE